jgi:hypothetical protein
MVENLETPPETLHRYDRITYGGFLSGIIGGLFLSAMNLVMTALRGQSLWPVFKGAATPFYGERVMSPSFDLAPFAVGILCHFLISICWALAFAFLFYGLARSATLIAGAGWGFVVWIGMYYVVLPAVGLGAMARGMSPALPILEHVLFGLVVAAAFLPYQRTTGDRWRTLRRRVENA